MTEHPDQDDRLDLEHRLDRVLTKYLTTDLARQGVALYGQGDRDDLASDLADAARQHFTGSAADTPSPLGLLGVLARLQDAADHADYLMGPTVTSGPAATRVNSLRQSLYQAIAMVEAAREAPLNVQANPDAGAGARLAVAASILCEWIDRAFSPGALLANEARPFVEAVRKPLGELFAAGYNGMGEVEVPAVEVPTTELTAEDPPLWATANAAMVELFRAVRCLQVEDVARLDQGKVSDARKAMEWVEEMPTVLWPPPAPEDEEPF